MVSIASPRVSSAIAVIILFVYLVLLTNGFRILLNGDFQLIFLLSVGTFIFIAAFNFAGNELKKTDGVLSVFELRFTKLIGIALFALFLSIGYNALVLILIEVFASSQIEVVEENPFIFSKLLLTVILVFLVIYPFFQYLFLAMPGEDSSIPAEYVIEKILEFIASYIKSPFLVALIAYLISYIIPLLLLQELLKINFFSALVLVATILPLITLGALAGAGFGEDLIRLKMVRNPFRDLKKLGMPNINLKELNIDVGGLFLVLFAIQALITTTVFGILNILSAMGIIVSVTAIGTYTLFLTLFNKGRGSTKEMKEVWIEGGFKVNIFQLFLPVYVFLGVIMSSALEILVGQPEPLSLLNDIGLADHLTITRIMLVIQNFVLVYTAIVIFRRPPGTAERRLIKEVPKFYGSDTDGYLYIYSKLKSERSIENLAFEMAKLINKDPSKADSFKSILRKSLETGGERVQIASSKTLFIISEKLENFDKDYFELIKLAINSEYPGARIYSVKAMKNIIKTLSGVDKEEAIKLFQLKILDHDNVVSWDTGIALQQIIKEEPAYRNFILALMIKSLNTTTYEGSINAITRFLNRISNDSEDVGRAAISILGVQLSSGESDNLPNIIEGIRSIIRANPYLVDDLIDVVAVGVSNPDIEVRGDAYQVLSNLAQYGSGSEEEILQLIVQGIGDEATDIQIIAYEALANNVINHPELIDEIYALLVSNFEYLRGEALIGALNVLEAIARINFDIHEKLFYMIEGASKSSTPIVRSRVFDIMAIIVKNTPTLSEKVYYIAEANLNHDDDIVRAKAIIAIGEAVVSNSTIAKAVYRKVSKAREDDSLRVQLAAIEALGYVASANRSFTDEIFNNLKPLLRDDDWQVRLSALNGLFAASLNRKDLVDEFTIETSFALTDADRTIRSKSLDIINHLASRSRKSAEILVPIIKKNLKVEKGEIRATLLEALGIIVSHRVTLVNDVLSLFTSDMNNEFSSVRNALIDSLKLSVGKLSKIKEPTPQAQKILNQLITAALKATNNSNPAIKHTGYEVITEICVALPSFKVANRGRTALETSIKREKDVGLQEFLETCRIRSKRPLKY